MGSGILVYGRNMRIFRQGQLSVLKTQLFSITILSDFSLPLPSTIYILFMIFFSPKLIHGCLCWWIVFTCARRQAGLL